MACSSANAEALERLEKVRVVVLDKTGTLTEGKPRVTDIVRAEGAPAEDELLALVAAAERGSEHPLGERDRPARPGSRPPKTRRVRLRGGRRPGCSSHDRRP